MLYPFPPKKGRKDVEVTARIDGLCCVMQLQFKQVQPESEPDQEQTMYQVQQRAPTWFRHTGVTVLCYVLLLALSVRDLLHPSVGEATHLASVVTKPLKTFRRARYAVVCVLLVSGIIQFKESAINQQ